MERKKRLQLERLNRIAELIKDAALADLSAATRACEETRRHLDALAAPMPEDSPLPIPALEAAALLHQRWAEPRRIRLNETLALQTATRLDCEAAARRALGRAEVIAKLSAAQRHSRR